MNIDITDRKIAKQNLKDSEQRLAAIFARAAVGLCEISPQGKFIKVNAELCRMLGRSSDNLMQMSISDVTHPQDVNQSLVALKHTLEKGESISLDKRYIRPDGHIIFASSTLTRLDDQNGKAQAVLAVTVDLTAYKKSEEELIKSRQHFQSIIQAIPSFTFEGDAFGNNTFASEQWYNYTGMTPEQTRGYGWSDAIHPDDAETVAKRWSESMKTGKMFNSKHRLRGKNGNYRWFMARSLPVRNPEGKIIHWMGSLTDIDDLIKTEQALRNRKAELRKLNQLLEKQVAQRTVQLEQQNQKIRQLAHQTIRAMENDRKALAKDLHDSIGGTLAAIKYQLEARVENAGTPPPSISLPLEKIIIFIEDAIEESRRMTKQLRSSALDDFGLNAVIDEHCKDFQQFYPSIKIDYQIDISEKDLSNDTKTVIYRVIQESLNNVGRHSKAQKVDIRCYHQADRLMLKIQDDGVGFAAQNYFRDSQFTGGYGLFSMKERVEICKGSLAIESEPGKGTTIMAAIPMQCA